MKPAVVGMWAFLGLAVFGGSVYATNRITDDVVTVREAATSRTYQASAASAAFVKGICVDVPGDCRRTITVRQHDGQETRYEVYHGSAFSADANTPATPVRLPRACTGIDSSDDNYTDTSETCTVESLPAPPVSPTTPAT